MDQPPTLRDIREALLVAACLSAYRRLADLASEKGARETEIREVEGEMLIALLDFKQRRIEFPHLRGDIVAAEIATFLNDGFVALSADRLRRQGELAAKERG